MSSEVYQDSHYIYAGQDGTPWHGVGTQRNGRMTIEDVARFNPRFAETPVLCRLWYGDPSKPNASGTGSTERKDCGDLRAIVSPSNGYLFGTASKDYKPRSYVDIFRRVFGWVEQLGAHVSGAALLQGGRRAFIMARCPSLDFTVGGEDKHEFWLPIFSGHDGKTGIHGFGTTVRVVCANTVRAGMEEAGENGALVSIAHTGNVDGKLASASETLGQLVQVRDAYERAMGTLLAKQLTAADTRETLSTLFPGDSGRAENAKLAVERLARSGRGNVRYAGTAYALLQGVTDYVDHEAVKTSSGDVNERRFLYATTGAGAQLKRDALQLLLNGSPVKVAA
jgi:phage/plasmid-like protein (TIGR03299 family)